MTMTFVKTFLRDESGASAAEYALILAIIGAAIVTGALALGGAIGNELTDKATCVETPTVTNCA
ncbi:Flp family type IVb pilin [Altererythrobacter sp. Z27]|uniref:Flp family type IVb pilin n=1 Tax=Altererythrobacter sp. Z27 TaxID=3461147 RepID=UPI0040449EE0